MLRDAESLFWFLGFCAEDGAADEVAALQARLADRERELTGSRRQADSTAAQLHDAQSALGRLQVGHLSRGALGDSDLGCNGRGLCEAAHHLRHWTTMKDAYMV